MFLNAKHKYIHRGGGELVIIFAILNRFRKFFDFRVLRTKAVHLEPILAKLETKIFSEICPPTPSPGNRRKFLAPILTKLVPNEPNGRVESKNQKIFGISTDGGGGIHNFLNS